jgi:UDP-N-acetylglucosamine transferase subunit ALG13
MSTLVAFGNLERPFDRMAECVLREIASMPRPVVIQAGHNLALFSRVPSFVTVFPTCGFERFGQLIAQASAVITHGGAGTIHAAASNGLRPAVFVRRGDLGEHIDNHQVEWCQRVFAAGVAEEMHDHESLRKYLSQGMFVQSDMAAARAFFDCSAMRADLQRYIRSILAGK